MGSLSNSRATTPVSEYDAAKVVTYNEALQVLDNLAAGQHNVSITTADVTLTGTPAAPQAQNKYFNITGTLTGNRSLIFPVNDDDPAVGNPRVIVVKNATAGAFAVTVKVSGQTGVTVAQGSRAILLHNGTDFEKLFESISATGVVTQAVTVNAQTGTTYTYLDTDRGKLVTHSNTSAVAGTLPQAGASSQFIAGWFMFVENRNTGLLTITPTTSTIDGAASIKLPKGHGCLIVSDGTNYFTGGSVPLDAWDSWTPTWINLNVGNGTLTAKYKQIGKVVIAHLELVFGNTTTVTGLIQVSLPVTLGTYGGAASSNLLGHSRCLDASTANNFRGDVVAANTTSAYVVSFSVSGSNIITVVTSGTAPFTWTTSDEIHLQFCYEAA